MDPRNVLLAVVLGDEYEGIGVEEMVSLLNAETSSAIVVEMFRNLERRAQKYEERINQLQDELAKSKFAGIDLVATGLADFVLSNPPTTEEPIAKPVMADWDARDFATATIFRERVIEALNAGNTPYLRFLLGGDVMDAWATSAEKGDETYIRKALTDLGFGDGAIADAMPDIRKVFFTEFPHVPETENKVVDKGPARKVLTPEEKRAKRNARALEYYHAHSEEIKAKQRAAYAAAKDEEEKPFPGPRDND